MAIQTAADNQVTVLSASWNNGSTAYTAFKVDVNNVLTPATSKLFDVGTNTGTYSSKFNIDVSGSTTSVGSMLLGTTRQMQLLPDYGGSGELLAGSYISSVGNNSIFMIPSSNGFTGAAATAGIGYYNGTGWYSALQVSNVASGFGNLALMRSGGRVGIGTTNPLSKLQVSGSAIIGTDGVFVLANNVDSTSFYDSSGTAYFYSPQFMTRRDSSGTSIDGTEAAAVIYNKNGSNNTWAKLSFAMNETSAVGANPVSIAGIAAQKTAGNAGGWASGDLAIWTKNASAVVEVMRATSGGNVGIGKTNPTTNLDVVGSIRSTSTSTAYTASLTNGTVTLREAAGSAANNIVEVHVRPVSGKSGYVSFTEDTVNDRWSIGIQNGNSSLRFLSGYPTTGVERMTLTSAGRLGIGITGPGYALDVVGQIKARNLAAGDTTGITLGSNGVEKARIQFTASDDSARFKMEVAGVNSASERLSIYAGPLGGAASNEALVIGGNGNVGIGTGTLITARLLVTGSGTGTGATAHFVNSSGTSLLFVRDDGNVGVGSSSPAQRLDVNGVINAGTGYRVGNTTPTAGNYLRSNGSNFIAGTIQVSDVPTLNQNTTGYAGSLLADDNRTIAPNEYSTSRLNFGFTGYNNTNAPPYADFLHLASYVDSSGGRENLLMFNKSSLGMRLWQSAGFGTSAAYSTYKDIVLAENSPIANYVLKYSGTGNSVSAANSNIFDNGTNVGIGTTTSMTSAFTVHSGVDGVETAVVDVTGATGSIGVGKFIRFVGGPGVGWTNNYAGGAGLWLGAGTSTKTLYVGTAGTYSGNVGINSTLPTNLLTVNQASNTSGGTTTSYGFMLNNQGTARLSIGNDGSYSLIQSWNNNPLIINNQGNNIILAGANANVGIHTTTVSARLHVQGSTNTLLPTLLVKENQAMANATATFDVQNSAGSSLFFVSGSGNIGIGTNVPTSYITSNSTVLAVAHTGNVATVRVSSGPGLSSGNQVELFAGTDRVGLWGTTNVPMLFYTNTTEKMRITSGGDVGIGTTSYTARLHVSGSSTGTTPSLLVRHGIQEGSDLPIAQFQNAAGSNRFAISGSGFVSMTGNEFQQTSATNDYYVKHKFYNSGASYLGYVGYDGSPILDVKNDAGPVTITPGTFSGATLNGGYFGLVHVDGSDAKVGINTTAPNYTLDIQQPFNGDCVLYLGTNAASYLYTSTYYFVGSDDNIGSYSGTSRGSFLRSDLYPIIFHTNYSERMRIDTSGNVGIGTTSITTARLHVQGGAAGTDTTLRVRHGVANGSSLPVLDVQNSAGNSLLWVSGSGFVGMGTTSNIANNKVAIYGATAPDTFAGHILLSSNTASSAADNGGQLNFQMYDGTSLRGAGFIKGAKENGTSGNYATYLSFGTRNNGDGFNTERMRIDSTGSIGIGTTIAPARVFVTGSTSTSQPAMVVRAGTSVQSGGTKVFQVLRNNGTGIFHVSGSGDVTVDIGNLVIGTSGKGIDFGATPSASSGSLGQELFDDYEEGSFTPGLAVGGGGSITTSTASGTYTKMGRVVVCMFFFEVSSVSGTRNTLQITGFPFQMDVTYANCFLELYNLNNAATGLTGNFAHGVGWASVPSNRLNVSIYLRTSGTPLGGLNETPANAFQANTIMAGVVTYFTNQ